MTSLEELRAALNHYVNPFNGPTEAAFRVYRKFEKSNPTLSKGWFTIGVFFSRLGNAIGDDMRDIHDELEAYINASESNEDQEQRAVDRANEDAEEILKELDIKL